MRGDERADGNTFANPVLHVDLEVWSDAFEEDQGDEYGGHCDATVLEDSADD